MNAKTHVKIGLAACIGAMQYIALNKNALPITADTLNLATMAGGSIIGSLLMDNDAKGTTISHFLPISNRIITFLANKGVKACYHRHLFHSLLFLPLIVGGLLCFWKDTYEYSFRFTFFFGLLLGLVGHALADALLSNTWLFYPVIRKPISFLRLKQTENQKIYTKIEKACSFLATIALFIGLVNYFCLKNYNTNIFTVFAQF